QLPDVSGKEWGQAPGRLGACLHSLSLHFSPQRTQSAQRKEKNGASWSRPALTRRPASCTGGEITVFASRRWLPQSLRSGCPSAECPWFEPRSGCLSETAVGGSRAAHS